MANARAGKRTGGVPPHGYDIEYRDHADIPYARVRFNPVAVPGKMFAYSKSVTYLPEGKVEAHWRSRRPCRTRCARAGSRPAASSFSTAPGTQLSMITRWIGLSWRPRSPIVNLDFRHLVPLHLIVKKCFAKSYIWVVGQFENES